MRIENDSSPNTIKTVLGERTLCSGRKVEYSVECLVSPFYDEGPSILVPGVNLLIKDVNEFIETVKIAAMIASGKLEID